MAIIFVSVNVLYRVIMTFHCILLQVKIWFQNRRMKWRNSKERELLSNGVGNRDTTIPSKENPHPDLTDTPESDADESHDLTDATQSHDAHSDTYHDDTSSGDVNCVRSNLDISHYSPSALDSLDYVEAEMDEAYSDSDEEIDVS